MPTGKKVLSTRLSFKAKLIDVINFYQIRKWMCANRSKMIQGLGFIVSCAHIWDADVFRLSITFAASEGIILVFIDLLNSFQTNVISAYTPNNASRRVSSKLP